MSFFKKLFAKKPGGTFVGNLIRGAVNTGLGTNIQGPAPSVEAPYVSYSGPLPPPDAGTSAGGLLGGLVKGVSDASKTPAKVNSLITVVIIAIAFLAIMFGLKSRR